MYTVAQLEGQSVFELRKIASLVKLKNYIKFKKPELIEKILETQEPEPKEVDDSKLVQNTFANKIKPKKDLSKLSAQQLIEVANRAEDKEERDSAISLLKQLNYGVTPALIKAEKLAFIHPSLEEDSPLEDPDNETPILPKNTTSKKRKQSAVINILEKEESALELIKNATIEFPTKTSKITFLLKAGFTVNEISKLTFLNARYPFVRETSLKLKKDV